MKYKAIGKELFIKNRKKFIENLKENSLALFDSNDIYPTGADSYLPFKQHPDFFYLCGIDQEESILLLLKQENHSIKEILFIKKTNEHIARWEGKKLSKEKAYEISGIKDVFWLEEFESLLYSLTSKAENIYLNLNEHYRAKKEVQTRQERRIEKIKNTYPIHSFKRSNPILQRLRSVKEPVEIELIKKACEITGKGFDRILKFLKPETWEFELEAEWICEFLSNRANGFAYSPIIASGKNACILHYIDNNQQCQEGELVLMDVGACYAHYNADLTRCVPVNGRFSKRQQEVYNAVLQVKKEAEKILIKGNNWQDYQKQVGEIMTSELLKLGLLDKADIQNQSPENPAYKKYFMHGTSHHLGLDTHDYGILSDAFTENMVFTIEPGIYICEEKLGIRLEDNYVIQKQGPPLNLTKNIPIEIQEIENMMNS